MSYGLLLHAPQEEEAHGRAPRRHSTGLRRRCDDDVVKSLVEAKGDAPTPRFAAASNFPGSFAVGKSGRTAEKSRDYRSTCEPG